MTVIMGFYRTFLALFILSSVGCSHHTNPSPTAGDSARTNYLYHEVKGQGETLAQISRWYTGTAKNWEKILSHNGSLDEKKLQIGAKIKIPEDIVTNKSPMPKLTQQSDSSETAALTTEEEDTRHEKESENGLNPIESMKAEIRAATGQNASDLEPIEIWEEVAVARPKGQPPAKDGEVSAEAQELD